MANNDVVLGRVQRTWMAANKVALLEPLYRVDTDTGAWTFIHDPKREFPNRGGVTWINAVEQAIEGSIWTFNYDTHQTFRGVEQDSDQYRINWATQPTPPSEVLHLGNGGSEALLRMLDRGLSLPYVPSRQVYIDLDGQTWVGPLRLLQENGRWFIDPQQRTLPIACVEPAPSGRIALLNIDGKRRFMWHGTQPGHNKGEVDWAPSKLVLTRILNWTRKNREGFAQATELTKGAIKEAVDALAGQDVGILAQQVTRARSYVADASRIAADLGYFESELLNVPAVQSRIQAAVEEARRAASEQIKAEFELLRQQKQRVANEITVQQQELASLKQRVKDAHVQETKAVEDQIAVRKAEIGRLDEQLAARQRELTSQVDLADEMLRERVAELVRHPQQALSEIALIRAAVGGAPTTSPQQHSARRQSLSLPSRITNTAPPMVGAPKDLVLKVRKQFLAVGLNSAAAPALHGALVSGLVPLVSGEGSLDALESYASAVVGGRWLWVNVPPTAMEPVDLLGQLDCTSSRFLPHPAGLLDLLLHAAQPENQGRLYLVVLDGVNRAAVDGYLRPFLVCYAAAWRPGVCRTLSVVHPSALEADNVYAAAARLEWPRNVLLAGTSLEGGATVPMPAWIWSDTAYVPISGADKPVSNGAATSHGSVTEVQAEQWAQWRSQVLADSAEAQTTVSALASGLQLPVTMARSCARLLAALRPLMRDDEAAISAALLGSLVPYGITAEQGDAVAPIAEKACIDEAALAAVEQVLR